MPTASIPAALSATTVPAACLSQKPTAASFFLFLKVLFTNGLYLVQENTNMSWKPNLISYNRLSFHQDTGLPGKISKNPDQTRGVQESEERASLSVLQLTNNQHRPPMVFPVQVRRADSVQRKGSVQAFWFGWKHSGGSLHCYVFLGCTAQHHLGPTPEEVLFHWHSPYKVLFEWYFIKCFSCGHCPWYPAPAEESLQEFGGFLNAIIDFREINLANETRNNSKWAS